MAGLKIKGDLSQISDVQLDYIKSVIKKQGYKENNVIVKPVGQPGDNYTANVKRIIVEDGKGGTFKMVAKLAPNDRFLRKMLNTKEYFRNERIMYMKILPKFTQLEEHANVPPQEKLKYAICYGSFDVAPNEVILLEDLTESGFIKLDKFKALESTCVKSILKNFASLHSLSYVLIYKEPKAYKKYRNSLFDTWSSKSKDFREIVDAFLKQMENTAKDILDLDVYKKAVQGAVTGSSKTCAKISKTDRFAKHSVIVQGDAWINNILFKFEGENLLESLMIDYQISKAASPVYDLLFMIFNCTDYKTRKKHFYNWIDYYYNELDNALSRYGLKANFVYPRYQLDVDLYRYAKACFGQSIIFAGIITTKTEDADYVKEEEESDDVVYDILKSSDLPERDPETVAIYKEKIEGLVQSYLELGLL